LRDDMATALQIAGAASVVIGLGMVWLPLGFICAGTFALLFGIAIERQK
jgi:hypothetical protein